MLTIEQLQTFSLKRQANYIWEYGTRISSRSKGKSIISLYKMGNYFAQIVFNDSENKIEEVIVKESIENESYLRQSW